ncbi:MAG: hypothetical protein KDE53_36975, partial [Caldilineaceae bacterium]|nr:hypothetical protein [Caldilineaceae bacterium]
MMVSNLCIALLLTGCILPPIPLNLGDHAPNTASPPQAISSNVELVEQIPGPALTVAVQGDYAYLGFSFNVAVIDVSDPTNPHVAASLLLSANDLVIADNKLYVAGRAGLFVVDITAPTAPTVLGQLTVDETLTAVAVKGAYVYLIHHHDLLVIDASNPAFLQQIARVTMAHRIEKITIAGDHAYLSGSKGIDIVDISGPHQPALISHIPSSTSVYGPVVVGDFAYFIQDQQLFTLDVSDPATPQVIAQSSMPGLYGQFVLVGSLAYVANLGRGLEIFDLAAPDNVQPLGAYRSRSYALDLVIKGDHAYVALLDEGLNIIDIGNPTAPELVGNLLRLGPVYDVASAQGKLYCIAGWDGLLHQWNLQASPCLPAEICHVSSTAIFDFVVQDHLIYAIDPRGLLVIDVADATVPTTLATYPLADAWSLALADHTVYISGRSGTVTAIDVSDPAQPQLLATYANLGFVRAMVFAGDYAYLPRGEG